MTDLLAARSQMAMSLAFHIVFAAVGIGMPLLMLIAEAMWLRTGDGVYLALAKLWSKGTAILFAIGAVSGTVLSFELGLLWPRFMEAAGAIIGMPFSFEGFAFFLEAIFLGIYLYGWKLVSARAHLFAGTMVLLSGVASGAFVVCANGWMNAPTGFRVAENGDWVDIDPLAATLNDAAFSEGLHMTCAAFVAVGFLVSGIHAFMLLRQRRNAFHRRALGIALTVGAVAAFLQPITGHVSADMVAHTQPVKLAAMEAHWETQRRAPFRIGGWPDEATETTPWSIEVPVLLSLIAYGDPEAEVLGLSDVPEDERPPVLPVHLAFQVMVGAGMVLLAVAAWGGVLAVRRRGLPDHPAFLWALVACAPLGMIAIEAGWVVTEVGRQPWIVQGLLRTADAVTPMPGLVVPFLTFSGLYLVLSGVVIVLLVRLVRHSPTDEDA
jgi:cytochrome d ubiquinol oxidase subunit I